MALEDMLIYLHITHVYRIILKFHGNMDLLVKSHLGVMEIMFFPEFIQPNKSNLFSYRNPNSRK